MAVSRITEPASTNPMTVDWQQLLNKLTATCGHLLEVDFVDYGSTTPNIAPKIKAGSRFEVNGSFFVVDAEDEDITGFASIANGGNAYIYAIPNQPDPGGASTCTFEYSSTVPTYQVALGGMFNGVNRAIGYLEKSAIGFYKMWVLGPVPARNVKLMGAWQCATPPLPTSQF